MNGRAIRKQPSGLNPHEVTEGSTSSAVVPASSLSGLAALRAFCHEVLPLDEGSITQSIEDIQIVRHLLSTTMGAQIMAVLYPAEFSPRQQIEALDAYLAML